MNTRWTNPLGWQRSLARPTKGVQTRLTSPLVWQPSQAKPVTRALTPKMDTTGSSEELDTSLESSPGELADQTEVRSPHRSSPFTLRSQCAHVRCPMGTGILFRSRISPSPSKQWVYPSHTPTPTSANLQISIVLFSDFVVLHIFSFSCWFTFQAPNALSFFNDNETAYSFSKPR